MPRLVNLAIAVTTPLPLLVAARAKRAWNNARMASRSKASRRDAILDAMLDVVVERGFHDAPISLIARRSGASAGIIYHYFSSKEDVIKALYERIRTMKIEAFLAGFDPSQEPGISFVRTFTGLYNFYRKHQREMRFYELCEYAGFMCKPELAVEDERATAFAKCFSSRSQGGVLKEWPTEVIEEMTVGFVTRLARQEKRLSDLVLRDIAETTWKSIRAVK